MSSYEPYVCTKHDSEKVLATFQEGSRQFAREDYAPHEEEVEMLFLYALAVECTGAPGFYASQPDVRERAAVKAGKAFIVAADSGEDNSWS